MVPPGGGALEPTLEVVAECGGLSESPVVVLNLPEDLREALHPLQLPHIQQLLLNALSTVVPAKALNHPLCEALMGDVLAQRLEVGHPASDRGDALALHLELVGVEEAPQGPHVDVDEKRAVVQGPRRGEPVRGARHFAPTHHNVVAPAGLRRQPKVRERPDDDVCVSLLVVVVDRGEKGEVGVAAVLVHSPPPARPPG
eukprot:CAMPEP_0174936196 /NCGR_PEP_ID=MMETSP1355-20121228/56614_1 /TAXON_ID=464990 /ORGANISM="Hemiselmis tepida, Strain CCMP443" /LENGTH=198 /DNA_ID=CAMNT_0016182959 /DNA_START=190 /DNA_END=785 /DNA_ORIENTATION=-